MEIVLRLADVFRENLPISKSKKSHSDASVAYCREVITQVIKTRRPLVVSNIADSFTNGD